MVPCFAFVRVFPYFLLCLANFCTWFCGGFTMKISAIYFVYKLYDQFEKSFIILAFYVSGFTNLAIQLSGNSDKIIPFGITS